MNYYPNFPTNPLRRERIVDLAEFRKSPVTPKASSLSNGAKKTGQGCYSLPGEVFLATISLDEELSAQPFKSNQSHAKKSGRRAAVRNAHRFNSGESRIENERTIS